MLCVRMQFSQLGFYMLVEVSFVCATLTHLMAYKMFGCYLVQLYAINIPIHIFNVTTNYSLPWGGIFRCEILQYMSMYSVEIHLSLNIVYLVSFGQLYYTIIKYQPPPPCILRAKIRHHHNSWSAKES